MSSALKRYRDRTDKLVKHYSSIVGKPREITSAATVAPPTNILAFVTNTIPTEEGGFGEDASNQINIFVPNQLLNESDHVYFYNTSYDSSFTEFSSMLVYINSVPRSVITFTSDRINTEFWYKTSDYPTSLLEGIFTDGEVFLTI